MKRLLLGAVAVLLGTACSSRTDRSPLEEVSRNLQELRSGILELRVTALEAPGGSVSGGFELIGSWQTGDEDGFPVADVGYRDLAAPGPGERFTSTGEVAFITVSGQAYELPEEYAPVVRAGSEGQEPLFDDVDIRRWVTDPVFGEGEGLDGAPVHRVTGGLDVVEAAADLFGLAGRLGRPVLFEPLAPPDSDHLEDAVQVGRIELISGAEDLMLRRILIEVEMKEGARPLLLGGLAGRTLILDLSLSEPNRPVTVEAPADPLPFHRLERAP